jgi:hypothetical protein
LKWLILIFVVFPLIPMVARVLLGEPNPTPPTMRFWYRFWHGKPVVTEEMREKNPLLYGDEPIRPVCAGPYQPRCGLNNPKETYRRSRQTYCSFCGAKIREAEEKRERERKENERLMEEAKRKNERYWQEVKRKLEIGDTSPTRIEDFDWGAESPRE